MERIPAKTLVSKGPSTKFNVARKRKFIAKGASVGQLEVGSRLAHSIEIGTQLSSTQLGQVDNGRK